MMHGTMSFKKISLTLQVPVVFENSGSLNCKPTVITSIIIYLCFLS